MTLAQRSRQASSEGVEPGRDSLRRWAHALLALGIAVAVIGPGLGRGALFNLDLVAVPWLDVPRGFFGLGPELPRRTPFWVPIALLSPVVPATLTVKVVMLAVFVGAWCGMRRWALRLGVRWPLAAAAVYAFSPFVLTRTAVGHLMITVPLAILPWVLPTLLRPDRDLRRTYLAAVALGLAGHFGGTLALAVCAASFTLPRHVRGPLRRHVRAVLVVLLAQAPWLVPGLLVALPAGASPATGAAFASHFDGPLDVFALSAGSGFWNTYFQVGGTGPLVAVLGAVLLAAGVAGTALLPEAFRRPLALLGAVGWLLPVAGGVPRLGGTIDALTTVVTAGVWRESQRLVVLHLAWLAPAAALGMQRVFDVVVSRQRWLPLAGPAALCVPVVAAVLAAPGLWGMGGQLDAVALPAGWEEARREVREAPGTVLALPWYQYYNQRYDDGRIRRVLGPMPLFLGGDVLASSDSGLQPGVRERDDPREAAAGAAIETLLRQGSPISSSLAPLGVRWVVVQTTLPIDDFSGLFDDPGLTTVIDTPDIALFEVTSWRGQVVDETGTAVASSWVGPFAGRVDGPADSAVVWNHPAAAGWRLGWTAAEATPSGLARFDTGSGRIWNLATVPALVASLGTLTAVLLVGRRVGKIFGSGRRTLPANRQIW